MARVIAFCNFKGGVGKTTLCTTLWCHGVYAGYSTVIVDVDPQGDATKYALGVAAMDHVPQGGGVEALAMPNGAVARTLLQRNTSHKDGADFAISGVELPANVCHTSATYSNGIVVPATPYWNVANATGLVLDLLPFDTVLVDTPPSIPVSLFRSIMAQVDTVVAPVEPEPYASQNVPRLLAEINTAGRGDLLANGGVRLVLNNRATLATHRVWESVLRNTYGDLFATTVVPRSAAMLDMANPGTVYKPRSTVGKLAAQLWAELIDTQNTRRVSA